MNINIATSIDLKSFDSIPKDVRSIFRFLPLKSVVDSPELAKSCIGIWIGLSPKIDEVLLQKFPNIEFVATTTTGLTHIDLEYLNSKDIRLLSLTNEKKFLRTITSTSELAWGLMLTVWRKILLSSVPFQNPAEVRNNYISKQLLGLTVGIIGMGRIGEQIALYAKAFGMTISFFDPYQKFNEVHNIHSEESLENLVKKVDVIFLTASVLESDYSKYPLLNSKIIKMIKPNSIVINVARGILLDEVALADSLRQGNLFGVGVDVLKREELFNEDDSVSELEVARNEGFNVVITPHIGGICVDAFHKCINKIAQLILSHYSPQNSNLKI